MKTKNLVGQTFGRWSVIAFDGVRKGHSEWVCRCSCGTVRPVTGSRLLNGTSRSCGCWQKENAREQQLIHGMWNSSEYQIWAGLVNRCTNPKNPDYARYGGRGIHVCDRWREDFRHFYEDMGPRPSLGYSIDRVDNAGDYSPANCRWATSRQQTRNARYNVQITYGGKTQTMADWASELGMNRQTLQWRIRNWPLEKALTQPLEIYKPRGG